MFDLQPQQGSQQWLQDRLGNCTASRFDDVKTEPRSKADRDAGKMSATAESYLFELLGEYLTGQPASDFESVAMRWGTEHEAEARLAYTEATGNPVQLASFVRHPTLPRVGCSPDGLVGDDGLIEIKCPFTTREHVRTAMRQEVPDQYYAQVQGQLWVTGRRWSHFVSYDPRVQDEKLRLVVVPVSRDKEFIAELDAAVTRFVRVLLQSIETLNERSIS